MRNLPPLYHWAPTACRDAILETGLRPSCPHRDGTLTVCLASTPSVAWALSGAMRERGAWDLWEVCVADTPVFRVRHWGRLCEWRIPRAIASHGLLLVASREW